MKTMLISMSFALFICGCNPPQTTNWEKVNRGIENMTELSALIAFSRDDVKPYQEQICIASNEVSKVLENFNNTNSTFEAIRGVALNAVKNMPSDVLEDKAKEIAVIVMDQVLDVALSYVEESYGNLVANEKSKIVLSAGRAVANGLKGACDAEIKTFSSRGLAKFTVEQKIFGQD